MKKQFILGITALALLAGSGATLASCQPTHENLNVSISLNRTTANLEIGSTITLRASVNPGDSGATDLTSTFTVDNPDVVQLGETTTNTTSVEITGLKVGTATITAASTVNPSITATCTITVMERRPTLPELFTSINKAHNYTLTATIENYYVSKETNAPITTINTSILTDNAYIQLSQEEGGERGAIWVSKETGGSMYGTVVAADDYAVYLQFDPEGNLDTSSERILSQEGGFLTKDNFDGTGFTNPFSGGLFASLSSIDPIYYPSEKSDDNTYEITGTDATDDGIYLCYVEDGLLNTFAPQVYQDMVQASVGPDNTYSLATVASNFTTTIEVLDAENFKVVFEIGEATITGTISKIGETSLADVSDVAELANISTQMSSINSVLPELNDELAAVKAGFEGNNYVQGMYSYINEVQLTYDIYYADNYVFMYHDQEFVDAYNKLTGKNMTVNGFGFYWKDGNLWAFNTDASNQIITEEGSIGYFALAEEGLYEATDPIYDIDIFTISQAVTSDGSPLFANYFELSTANTDDFFYLFSEEATPIWQEDTTEYHVAFNAVANAGSQDLIWGYSIEEPSDSAITGINVVMNTGNLSQVNFSLGWPTSNGMFNVSGGTYSNFGTAEEANPLNDTINTFFKDITTETPAQ